MKFLLAFAENEVPSTKVPDPYMHVFLDACEVRRRLDEVKWAMLEEWSKTKRAPRHAAWAHDVGASQNALG